jgi:predicted alpha-1,2-mannosidase
MSIMLAFQFKKWLCCLLLAASSTALVAQHNSNFLQYVNPLMGTDSRPSLSTGNTYPAIALPWGMNFWCPQTGKNGDGWMYSYGDNYIRGFKQTHQPSPWINDYGIYSIMPVTGSLKTKEEDRKSFFSHKAEMAKPHYYSVYLADHHTRVELAPTERCASFQIHFPATDSAFVVIDAFDKGSFVKIIPSQKKLLGYSTKNSGGVPQNFKNYFVVYFDEAFTWSSATNNEAVTNTAEITADHAGAVLQFNSKKATTIHLKTGSSFISWEQAELNVKRELGKDNFATTLQKATRVWNSELGKLQVKSNNIDNLRTFYSCLYRMLLFPRKFYEYDSNNQLVHYSPYNGNVHPGYMFTDNGFWDTFRAAMPFIALMYPAMDAAIMEGLANAYKESGFLPEWASPGHPATA